MEPLADYDPREVGGFRLQARLGAGGMGRVYLGYSPGGRPVAVKVVHPDLARDPEFMQRFRREVAAAQAVSDAYTAAVIGAGPDDSPPWLATTFVSGPSLADLIRRSGPLPEDAVWRLAGGLAEALQAIHAQGLVHRDLKPGNILVAADGPRVIDFGISRVTGGTVVTATRMTIGTPAYMSPEQAEGNQVGPPSDIFSLGSVLAFAATGVAPFDSATGEMFAVAYRVVNGEPSLGGVPAALLPMIGACLAKDPAGRPALGDLMRSVAAASAAYPQVTPGQFWPDAVTAVLQSSAFTPALPPAPATPAPGPGPAPATPASATPVPATPVPATPATTDIAATPDTPVPDTLAAGTRAPAQRPAPGTGTAPARPYTPATTARASSGRRGPRWLLPAALGVAVAAGAGIAIALAVSPSPKPPAFLGASGTPTSGTAAASAAGAQATVFVCTTPASGCLTASAARHMAQRPQQIDATADGSQVVTSLSWSNWGTSHATATGVLRDSSANTSFPATVAASDLTRFGSGQQAYADIVISAPSAPVHRFEFLAGTVPAS